MTSELRTKTETYYHMKPAELEPGEMIKPSGCIFTAADRFLELHRPSNMRSRQESVFLSSDKIFHRYGLSFKKGHIYQVTTDGELTRRDCEWIGVLQRRLDPPKDPRARGRYASYDDLSDEEIARKYWVGEPSEKPFFEFSVKSCTILCRRTEGMVTPQSTNPDSIEAAYAQVNESI